MPTYEYRCSDCTNSFEVVQKFSDASLTECPDCEGSLRKVFSPVGVVFKGSGFYATDNRTKGASGAATATKPDVAGSASSSGESSSSTASTSSSTSGAAGASAATSKPKSEPKASTPAA